MAEHSQEQTRKISKKIIPQGRIRIGFVTVGCFRDDLHRLEGEEDVLGLFTLVYLASHSFSYSSMVIRIFSNY